MSSHLRRARCYLVTNAKPFQCRLLETFADINADTRADKKEILVPLTNSLYVKGQISRPDRVLVDIGTGFYIEKVSETFAPRPVFTIYPLTIEKDVKSAAEFYEGKIKDLGGNIADLETIVQNKSNTLRAVEEVLKTKILANSANASS